MKTQHVQFLFGFILALNATISHAERFVIVNGERLNDEQIYTLEQIHCGPVPNGNYWLDLNTGLWGYAGNPMPQGYLTDNCYQQQQQQHRPGLSERGQLYSPGELLR